MLIPEDRQAAAASVARYSQAVPRRQRMTRAVLSATLRTGIPQRTLRDRLTVTVDPGERDAVLSLEDHLGDMLGEPVLAALGLGTLRANRKPVLQVFGRGGRALAFVKVGDTSESQALIEREAVALRAVTGHAYKTLEVPRVLGLATWHGLGLLVLSALQPTVALHRPRRRLPTAAMVEFSSQGAEWHHLLSSPSWFRLTSAAQDIADGRRSRMFAEAVNGLRPLVDGLVCRHGPWHGDWTAWNMGWRGGRILLWDLERYDPAVPCGFDALHWSLQTSLLAGVRTDEAVDVLVRRAGALLAPFGVATALATPLALTYVLELCRRYVLAAQPNVGRPLRPRADELLTGLHRRLAAGSGQPLPGWTT